MPTTKRQQRLIEDHYKTSLIKYQVNDVLEHTESGRRYRILRDVDEHDRFWVEPTIPNQGARFLTLFTVVYEYANLTAMADGRYRARLKFPSSD